MSTTTSDPELLTEMVLRCVEAIPPGAVATYGDVAAVVGTGPRVVGAIMARHGGAVPWWRVVNSSGRLSDQLTAEAAGHWSTESTPVSPSGRVDPQARLDRDELAELVDPLLAELTQSPTPQHADHHPVGQSSHG